MLLASEPLLYFGYIEIPAVTHLLALRKSHNAKPKSTVRQTKFNLGFTESAFRIFKEKIRGLKESHHASSSDAKFADC